MKKIVKMRRLLIAPVATVLAIYAGLAVIGVLVRGPAFLGDVGHKLQASETPILFAMSLAVAYFAIIVIGVPATIALSHYKRRRLTHFLSAGLLGGIVLGLVGGLLTLLADFTSYRYLDATVVGLCCCLITTVLMGVVWVIIRPDRAFSG